MMSPRSSRRVANLFLTVCLLLSGWTSVWHSANHLVLHSPLGETEATAYAAAGHAADHHDHVILAAHLSDGPTHSHLPASVDDSQHGEMSPGRQDRASCQLLHLFADSSAVALQAPDPSTLQIFTQRVAVGNDSALYVEARLVPGIRGPPVGIS